MRAQYRPKRSIFLCHRWMQCMLCRKKVGQAPSPCLLELSVLSLLVGCPRSAARPLVSRQAAASRRAGPGGSADAWRAVPAPRCPSPVVISCSNYHPFLVIQGWKLPKGFTLVASAVIILRFLFSSGCQAANRMSPGHLDEIASVFLCGAGCACSGTCNTVFSSQKTCSGAVGSHVLTEGFLDNTHVLADRSGWSQPQCCFTSPLLQVQSQGLALQPCRAVGFALTVARAAWFIC